MKHTREEKKEFYRKLFALVLPLALQNLMTALVSASDALMLGLLDQSSLSSVSLATQVQFVLNLFYAALTIGATVLAAQYWGKRGQGSGGTGAGHCAERVHGSFAGVFSGGVFLSAVSDADFYR